VVQPAVRGGPEQHRVDRPVADGVVVATLTTWFVVVDGGGAAPGGRFSRWSGLGRCSILGGLLSRGAVAWQSVGEVVR